MSQLLIEATAAVALIVVGLVAIVVAILGAAGVL